MLKNLCCRLVNNTATEELYDCTLDVLHFDALVFPGDWYYVPTRGRISRFPLPLFIRFDKQLQTNEVIAPGFLTGTVSGSSTTLLTSESSFLVYRYIKGDIPNGATKTCLKATVEADNIVSGSISSTYFKKLVLSNPSGSGSVVVYDDALNPPLCPGFTFGECSSSGPIDVEIDTLNHDAFNLESNQAGVCFYLTLDDDPSTGPKGLLDALNIGEGVNDITVSAIVGVDYSSKKRGRDYFMSHSSTLTDVIKVTKSDITSNASPVFDRCLAITVLVLSLLFLFF
eukprot:TRINITY_DN3641_c0_g1_i1.p1 TRINITY_DN3641_c0_g1~~TRINITY_DN3641_c0_g1_i1.p1  ORF type:complete len:329 (+),score=55.70 TRINITY_DN3641_c0_g1_i1:138-989(+)